MSTDRTQCVLLVDDDPTALEVTRFILEDGGFKCRTASNGIQALLALRELQPDVVISDLRMPRMSGFELLPIIYRRYPHIALIVISAEVLQQSDPLSSLLTLFLEKGSYSAEELLAAVCKITASVYHVTDSLREPPGTVGSSS